MEEERLLRIIDAKIHVVGNVFNNKFSIQPKKLKKKIKSIMFISQYVLKNNPDLPYIKAKKEGKKVIVNCTEKVKQKLTEAAFDKFLSINHIEAPSQQNCDSAC